MTDIYNNNIDPRIIQNDDAPITVAALDQQKPVANQLANINQQNDAGPPPIQETEKRPEPPFKPLSNDDNLDNVYIRTAQAQATQESLRELEELRERRRREREPKQQTQTQPTNIPSSPVQRPITQRGTTVDVGDGASFVQGGPQDKVATDKKIRVVPWYKEETWEKLGEGLVDAASQLGVADIAKAGWVGVKDFAWGMHESGYAIDKATTIAAREFVTNLSELDKWYKNVMNIDTNEPSDLTTLIHQVTGGDQEKIDRFVKNPFDVMLESDKLNVEKMHPEKISTVTGHLIQEGARAMIGFLPVLKAMKGVKALTYIPRYGRWLAAFGIGDYLTQPVGESGGKVTDPNVANAIEEFPILRNFVTEYLKLKEGDTREERKFKNFMANSIGSNIIADGLFHLVRIIGKGVRVKKEIDAQREIHGEHPERTIIGDDPGPEGTTNKPFEVDAATAERQLNEATAISPAAKPVYDDVYDQLIKAGRDEAEAKAAAAVYAARYQTRANRLGNDADPFQLYKEENVKISSVPDNAITDADRNLSARSFEETRGLNQPARAPIESVDDAFGTIAEKQDFRRLINNKASPAEIEAHPVAQRAIEMQRNGPRGVDVDDITPEYRAKREFDFNGEKVVGYDNALPRLRKVAEEYSKLGPVKNERKATIILGGPATGKSTLANPIAESRFAAIPDPDDVKKFFPEYQGGIGSGVVHEESSVLASDLLEQLVNDGVNIVIPKVGNNVGSIERQIKLLEANGYTVDLLHMHVDPDEAARRMFSRFLKTGRLIEQEYFKKIGSLPLDTYNKLKGSINGKAARYENNDQFRLVEGDEGLASEIESARARGLADRPTEPSPGTGASETAAANAEGLTLEQRAQPFYSAVDKAIKASKQTVATGQQWLSTLKQSVGVKPEELEWTGLSKFLKENNGKITKDELDAFFRDNQVELVEVTKGNVKQQRTPEQEARFKELDHTMGDRELTPEELAEHKNLRSIGDYDPSVTPPKFAHGNLVLPGGENQREFLITLPKKDQSGSKLPKRVTNQLWENGELISQGDETAVARWRNANPNADIRRVEVEDLRGDRSNSPDFYYRNHWDEPNVLAHIRVNERMINGKRTLFIEEIQSDWHQAGREQGYKGIGYRVGDKEFPSQAKASEYFKSIEPFIVGDRTFKTRAEASEFVNQSPVKVGDQEFATKNEAREFIKGLPEDQRKATKIEEPKIEEIKIEEFKKEPIDVAAVERIANVAWQKFDYAMKDVPNQIKINGEPLAVTSDRVIARLDVNDESYLSQLPENVVALARDFRDKWKAYEQASRDANKYSGSVPNAPFKKNWHELALKRAIKLAADEDFDQVAWTGGKIQNDRYNLAKHVSRITYVDGQHLKAFDHQGQEIISGIYKPEELPNVIGKEAAEKLVAQKPSDVSFIKKVKRDELSLSQDDHQYIVQAEDGRKVRVGKGVVSDENDALEYAERYFNNKANEINRERSLTLGGIGPMQELRGVDLEVGGEGMRGFYDKMLVNTANDIAKPFGTKAEGGKLKTKEQMGNVEFYPRNGLLRVIDEDGNSVFERVGVNEEYLINRYGEAQAREILNAPEIDGKKMVTGETEKDIHILPLSEKLTKTAREDGFKLFQPGDEPPKGWETAGEGGATPDQLAGGHSKGTITLNENDTIVKLFSTADQSTFMHESGHLWLDEMKRDAALADAPKQIKDDFDAILRWFGIDDANKIERSHHEQFARGFEEYLGTGKAPSPGLQGAFDRFKEWIVNIYKSLANVSNYDKITPEIRQVMDRMLATDPEIAAGKAKLFDEQGLTPEGMSFYGPRLQEHGYDSILVKDIIGPDGTPGKAVSIVPKQSAIERFPAVDFGVPEDVAARGISESAKEFANRAGVLRITGAPDVPTTRAADGQEVFINLGRVNSTDDVRQVLKDLADAFKPEIDEARRGVITHEQTRKLADEIGANETLDVLMQRGLGQVIDLEHTLAARNLLTTVGEEVFRLSDIVSMPTATKADKYNFMKAVSIHTAIQKQLLGSIAEAARILSAQRIMAKSRIEQARDIQFLIDNHGDQNIQNLAIGIKELKEKGTPPGGINLMVRRGWVTSGVDALKESYIMGLLWSPSTHAANFTGNAMALSMSIADRFVAEQWAKLFGVRPGSVVEGEAAIMFHAAHMASKDALKFAWKAMTTGESSITKGVNFLDTESAAISSRVIARERGLSSGDTEAFSHTAFSGFVDWLGKTARMPGRLLAGQDEFFKTYAWRAEVHAHSLRQATHEGLEGDALLNRINQLVNDPPEHITLAAADFAAYVTMQSKLGSYGQKLMGLRHGNMGALFLPVLTFVKTPTNILRFTFEHSPIAPLVGQWQDDFMAGGARRELALAKMSTGAVLMSLAFDLAIQNKITGVGEHDRGKREARARTGELSSSFDLGDDYLSFQRLDPAAMIVSFAATVHRMASEADQSPEDFDELTEIIAAGVSVVSAGVLDKSFFQGLSQLVTSVRSTDDGPRMFADFASRQIANIWPAGTAFNTVRRFVDPESREATNPMEYVMSKVAGWSHKLEPKLDLWGRSIKDDEEYQLYNILSPMKMNKKKNSPIDREMVRLGIGQKGIGWSETFRTMQGDPATINMTDFKKVRTKFIKLAGNELKDPANGLGAMDYLNAVVSDKHPDSIEYKDMKTDGEEGGKAHWIKNTIARYRKMAREEIMNDRSPEMKAFVDHVYERAAIEKKRRKQYEMEPDIEQLRP